MHEPTAGRHRPTVSVPIGACRSVDDSGTLNDEADWFASCSHCCAGVARTCPWRGHRPSAVLVRVRLSGSVQPVAVRSRRSRCRRARVCSRPDARGETYDRVTPLLFWPAPLRVVGGQIDLPACGTRIKIRLRHQMTLPKSLTRDSRSGVCTLNGCRPSGSQAGQARSHAAGVGSARRHRLRAQVRRLPGHPRADVRRQLRPYSPPVGSRCSRHKRRLGRPYGRPSRFTAKPLQTSIETVLREPTAKTV